MLSQKYHRPHNGIGNGIVSGVKHRDQLIANLQIVHGAVDTPITCGDEQTGEVLSRIDSLSTFGNHAINKIVYGPERVRESSTSRLGNRLREPHRQEQGPEL